MDLIGVPSAPRAPAPLSGLAAATASTAVVAESPKCASSLPTAALAPLVASNQPSRQRVLSRVSCRPCDDTLQFYAIVSVSSPDDADGLPASPPFLVSDVTNIPFLLLVYDLIFLLLISVPASRYKNGKEQCQEVFNYW